MKCSIKKNENDSSIVIKIIFDNEKSFIELLQQAPQILSSIAISNSQSKNKK